MANKNAGAYRDEARARDEAESSLGPELYRRVQAVRESLRLDTARAAQTKRTADGMDAAARVESLRPGRLAAEIRQVAAALGPGHGLEEAAAVLEGVGGANARAAARLRTLVARKAAWRNDGADVTLGAFLRKAIELFPSLAGHELGCAYFAVGHGLVPAPQSLGAWKSLKDTVRREFTRRPGRATRPRRSRRPS